MDTRIDGREGPLVTVEYSCYGCRYEQNKHYAVQGDSGTDVYCVHPKIGCRCIGDTTWDTPQWCPFRQLVSELRVSTVEGR